jgi:hypothetical protein
MAHADTTGLNTGEHIAAVQVRASNGAAQFKKDVLASIEVEPAITVVPSELFFGSTRKGQSVTRKLVFRLANADAVVRKDAVHLQHDMENELELKWSSKSDQFWELIATFTPVNSERLVEGMVSVTFGSETMRAFEIPVRAMIEPK